MKNFHQEHTRIALVIALLLSIGIFTTSCEKETNTQTAASQFGEEKSDKANPPSAAPIFRWDFSKADVIHTYSYTQEVQAESDMGKSLGRKSGGMGQETSTNGLLLVKSQGDSTAVLVLKDMHMSMKMDIGEDEPKTMEQQLPPIVVQGMQEDGSGSFGNSSQDMLLKMLFPLPSQALEVGESEEVAEQMPFNAMGSILQVTGRSRITLTQYVTIDDRTCAQLNVDTDISEINVPAELKGEYTCSTKGTSVFYFDVVSRSFVSGTIAMISQVSIDAPMPQMNIPGEDASDKPKRTKISMISDNLIKVELKE